MSSKSHLWRCNGQCKICTIDGNDYKTEAGIFRPIFVHRKRAPAVKGKSKIDRGKYMTIEIDGLK